jgi:hypothetical protein
MTMHAPELGTVLNVPDLDFARTKANTNISSVARPLNAADICIRACLQKAANSSSFSGPDVHVALEANGHLIARAPVQKIQIVIIY